MESCLAYQEIIPISPDPEDQSVFINHLRQAWRKWGRVSSTSRLPSIIRRVLSVTEPTTRVHHYRASETPHANRTGSIVVLSANLWHDWPFHRRQIKRLETFAGLVEQVKADIILLQEVSRTATLKVDEWLAGRLGMSSMYSRANGNVKIGFEEGLAVLSRFPLSEPKLTHLRPTMKPFVRRMALGARASTPAGHFWAFSVHLGINNRQNIAQQASLRHMLATLPNELPVLVGGDFNSHESSPQIHENRRLWIDTFRQLHPGAEATTHALNLPWGGRLFHRRLDYIYLRSAMPGWEILETRHLRCEQQPHSDHHAVYTRRAFVANN